MPVRSDEPSKLYLYAQLGFGGLVVFGMVGSLAGYRQGSAFVMVMTAVCWCMTKILVEAIDAWRVLHPDDRNSDPPAPPTPPASAT